jgi:Transposase DDE domain
MSGHKEDASGKRYILYVSRKSDCGTCPLRGRCLTDKADRRTIYRWEHEDVLERHRARMADGAELMRRRSALAEHPFGTLKCRAGYRHFLVRGFDKVRGEWSLMALCYNLSRVAGIVGIGTLIAYLAKRAAQFVRFLLGWVIAAVIDDIRQRQTVICRVPARLGASARPSRGHPA